MGNKRLREELDAVTIVKTVRQVRMMSKMLFNKKQRTLLRLAEDNVLGPDSSSESELDNLNYVYKMNDHIDDDRRIKTT